LSVTFNVAPRVPVVVGLKVTLIVQLALAANELPQPLVCAKSPAAVPAMVMLVIVIAVVPTLNLDRHCAVEARIPGAIDLAHPARSERRDNFIRPEFRARGEGHPCAPL
jgi:hypothetical protein